MTHYVRKYSGNYRTNNDFFIHELCEETVEPDGK